MSLFFIFAIFLPYLIFTMGQTSYNEFHSVPSMGRDAYVFVAWKKLGMNSSEDLIQFKNVTDFYIQVCMNFRRPGGSLNPL